MQAQLMFKKSMGMTTSSNDSLLGSRDCKKDGSSKDSRETIHSGHFMVSDFEAEAQDDEDELAVPVPDEEATRPTIIAPTGNSLNKFPNSSLNDKTSQQLSIETSLNKLFQCMSLAYRQKLTSPKWNRFKGIRLRWKDKIRLNNVIWRCWHMQFILKQNTLVCQFASPLDVDTHNKPEAVVLEGKYWKRKLAAVTAEYKKWRMFYRNKILGWTNKDGTEMMESMDMLEWNNGVTSSGNFGASTENVYGGTSATPSGESMMVDEDYMELMTDTLFSTISLNQPIYFPDPREIARGASLADFIQPSLGPLQPNLDDFMDTLEPLQEFLNSKLPPVPEEDDVFRSSTLSTNYSDLDLMTPINQINELSEQLSVKNEQTSSQQQAPLPSQEEQSTGIQNLQYTTKLYSPSRPESATYNRNNICRTMNDYSTMHQHFEEPSNHSGKEKRSSRTKGSRVIQQMQEQQQQQTPYEQNPQHQSSTQSTQQVVAVNSEQPSQILLQCRSSTMEPKTPIVQPSKLLSQPTATDIEKEEIFVVPKYQMKSRNRSRSSSSLTAPRMHPPPLVSAASDPTLNVHSNVLLAHLLTNNTSNAYLPNPSTDKLVSPATSQSTTTMKYILPMVSPTVSTPQVTNPITSPVSVQTSTMQIEPRSQPQQQQHSTCGQQILLNSTNSQSQTHQPLNTSPGSPRESSNVHSPQALSLSPLHSPMSIGSPLSPNRGYIKSESERGQYKEQRRVGHIHAEQKRRYNIKNGFDMLHSLIPQLSQNPNTKLSKAAMLQKGADYIRQLRAERNQLKEEMDNLRHQIECLNTSISNCQSMLPATGAPISRHRTSKMKEMFDDYVRARTRQNWKFWIFSILLEPLMISFNTSVSTASIEDLYRSTILWVEQHCSLVDLRPAVLNSLRYLCTATDILSDPARLPEEALAAVNRTEPRRSPRSDQL